MTTGIITEKGEAIDTTSLSLAELHSIMADFERNVDAALVAHRPTKDFVRSAIRRRGAGRCPTRLRRLSHGVVIKNAHALTALFREFPDDVVAVFPYDIWIGYQRPGVEPRLDSIDLVTRDVEWTDEWGVRWAHAAGGVGGSPVDHPIKDWSQLDEYIRSMPDPHEPGRFDEALRQVELHGETKYCIGQFHMPLWDRLQSLRGTENTFMDLYTAEANVCRLIEAITGFGLELIRSWGELGVDAVFLADDWGTQSSLMISPDMWRKFFKPHYARMFEEIHRLGMDAILHSCGNITDIVGDLLDIGLDALDPIQSGAMDQAAIAREFGGKIAFCGAIDVQHILVSGTPAQVKESIYRAIDTLGRPFGNSLLIGPGNMVTPDTPIENLQAMFEACHNQ